MLTGLLIRLFVRNPEKTGDSAVRLAYGLLAGFAGIAANLLLCAVKLAIGIFAGSVAVAADAVNNLSDAGSAIITVAGFKLAGKPADDEHPFGHGRFEYVAGLIVAVIIIAVGLNFFKESVTRIFSPGRVRADGVVLAVLASTLLVKIWLFFFYRRIGKTIDSTVIRAAAFDSLSDLFGTSLVLAALFFSRFTALPIDGCAGAVVAALVVWGGIGILRETVNPLLGECPDGKLVDELASRLLQCPEIKGVHDIIIHNYGPNRYFATAHAEVERDNDLFRIHDILENAEVEVARAMPVQLVLHCDPFDAQEPETRVWRVRLESAAAELDPHFKVYDFRLRKDQESGAPVLIFHLLIPREADARTEEIARKLTGKIRETEPAAELRITFLNSFV